MPTITWNHCVGQKLVKEVLEAAVVNNSLGHAYLFSGAAGSGKFAAALDLTLALLCEAKEGRPCLTCRSCTKVLHYAHPDFRVIMPVELSKEKKHKDSGDDITEDGYAYIADLIKNRLADPYALIDHAKIPNIPVQLVREMNEHILRGASDGKWNITVIDDVDTMNKESANGMLKLLEEPPAGTVLLLLTDRPSAVLPTIASRCQLLRFAWLPPEELRAELARRLAVAADDARLDDIVATGSLGKSLQLWNNAPEQARDAATRFWELCTQGKWPELAECIDELSEWNDIARYEQLFGEIMERSRDAFLSELPGTGNVFLKNAQAHTRDAPLSRGRLETILDVCEHSIAAIRAHGSITLVLANCALAITEALNGEKQQSR